MASSALLIAPVSGLNARAPLKVRPDHNVEQILFASPWNSRVRSRGDD